MPIDWNKESEKYPYVATPANSPNIDWDSMIYSVIDGIDFVLLSEQDVQAGRYIKS